MSTYTPIASVTLSSAQSSVTFNGIPQTYTDLVLVINGSMSGSGNTVYMRINNDSSITGFYSATYIGGNGTSAYSGRSSNTSQGIGLGAFQAGYSTGMYNIVAQIQNYSNTTTNKTLLSRWSDASSGGATETFVGLWRNTSAINSLEIRNNGGHNFTSGSTFNLYGVANASITNVAKATGGDSVTTDGTYWYHTFRSSGTFTPTQAISCDYLVVAGGGGGGVSSGGGAGGGGGGGLRSTVTATGGGGSLESPLSLIAQAYTVTVGAGGTTNQSAGQRGGAGSNSSFSGIGITTITSTGGAGGGGQSQNPLTGGSGGGGAGNTGGVSGSAGTANQGFAGGSSQSGDAPGGGGGGAGAVGANGGAQGGNGGAGGAGVAVAISGASVTYAGGGGGGNDTRRGGTFGAGGSGGGGSGGGSGSNTNPVAGTANLGGGGGGTQTDSNGNPGAVANGGSGIVIVRYSAA